MLISYKWSAGLLVIRAKILDSSQATPNGIGKTGLAFNTAGLNIATHCDNEAAPTVYTSAGSTIQAVAAIGTPAAPASGKCSFSQVDGTNEPGIYEFQFAAARLAVNNANGNAKFITVTVLAISAQTSAQCDFLIPLTDVDPYSRAAAFQAAMTEAYAAVGAVPTLEQAIMWLYQQYSMFSISGTTLEIFKLNGSTQAGILTLNNSSTPTAAQRTA